MAIPFHVVAAQVFAFVDEKVALHPCLVIGKCKWDGEECLVLQMSPNSNVDIYHTKALPTDRTAIISRKHLACKIVDSVFEKLRCVDADVYLDNN